MVFWGVKCMNTSNITKRDMVCDKLNSFKISALAIVLASLFLLTGCVALEPSAPPISKGLAVQADKARLVFYIHKRLRDYKIEGLDYFKENLHVVVNGKRFSRQSKESLNTSKYYNLPGGLEDIFAFEVKHGKSEIKLGSAGKYFITNVVLGGGKEYYFEVLSNPKAQNAGLIGGILASSLYPPFMMRQFSK